MSGWLDLTQLGLAPNQKHQALLGAPKIIHCGEPKFPNNLKENRPPHELPLVFCGIDCEVTFAS
jgi:hypothetical protein